MGNNLKLPEDTEKRENIHKGHRKRMRERYAENGLDGFQTHEVLEMLLFRSIVQGNTNPIAHAFLDKCGSMESVFEGNETVPGAAEKTLAMLRETKDAMEAIFLGTVAGAGKQSRSQMYTAAVRGLRRYPDGVFVLITDRSGNYREMNVFPAVSPKTVLAELKPLMGPDQLCHIACRAEPESMRELRKPYRTILGRILCLRQDWEPVWM